MSIYSRAGPAGNAHGDGGGGGSGGGRGGGDGGGVVVGGGRAGFAALYDVSDAGGMDMPDDIGSLMNGLDMEMSLPMDLDMDLAADASYAPLAPPTMAMQDARLMSQHRNNGNLTTPARCESDGRWGGATADGFRHERAAEQQHMEFTKRRNWSRRIIEELNDFLHILTPDGRILYVSPSCKAITGRKPHSLIGKFICEYVHPDDGGIFMREFNESIASGNSLRFFYRFKKDDGTYLIFECDGHPHMSPDPAGSSSYQAGQNGSGTMAGACRGFFMMARPYPTKNAALLDSFLEHKIENERLMKRIDELKREELEESTEQDGLLREHASGASQTGATPSESHALKAARDDSAELASSQGVTLSYQGITSTWPSRRRKSDSIAHKMSRYEANSVHLESIELLTGLRYRDGERSHGISTGDTSPALVRGDAGIAILLDRDGEVAKKEKKKLKVADEYVCANCGALDSPEWRRGPKGPKTLCNACGLRWAKKEKKRSGDDGLGIVRAVRSWQGHQGSNKVVVVGRE
ncbi:white collar 2 type of transcription factor, partial [Friedmanniomyces endolithicus]